VIFVADSQMERLEANEESVENLRTNLAEQGYSLEKIPVCSFSTTSETCRTPFPWKSCAPLINPMNVPDFEAKPARSGVGVFDTLKAVSKLVLNELKARAG